MTPTLPLSAPVFAILSAIIEEHLGLHFGPDQQGILADKLSPRVVELGFESMLDYYYFLRYDAEGKTELRALADVLTVNETYFFREVAALVALLDDRIAALLQAGVRPRIWCAACSSGEEPFSLAALLDERGWLSRVELVASDLSVRALAVAARGSYGRRALRAFPSAPSWLIPEGDTFRIAPRLHAAVEFRRINLLDSATIKGLGPFHAILCRNVMIYFRDDTCKALAASLYDALVDDGVLLVGASESLLRIGTAFECEERRGAFFYRKGRS